MWRQFSETSISNNAAFNEKIAEIYGDEFKFKFKKKQRNFLDLRLSITINKQTHKEVEELMNIIQFRYQQI